MTERHFEIGVILARVKLDSLWADHVWHAHAALLPAPDVAAGTPLGVDGRSQLVYAGAVTLTLRASETSHYRDNLLADYPLMWLALRPEDAETCTVAQITADPYEGEALTDGLGDIVETLPMPTELRDRLAEFVDGFHVDRPFFKRRRDRADLDALGTVARLRPEGR